jgi:hypothetical protein
MVKEEGMKDSFNRFGGACAIVVGVLSILYAAFYLGVQPVAPFAGALVAWLILAASGILGSAAYVALYQRTRAASEGYALFGLVLGIIQSAATLLNAVNQAVYVLNPPSDRVLTAVSLDPKGVGAFLVFAVASVVFGWLIVRGAMLPRNLGYVAYLNSVLLTLLFLSNVFGTTTLLLASGGLTSVIVTPLWWIWLGRELRREAATQRSEMQPQPA